MTNGDISPEKDWLCDEHTFAEIALGERGLFKKVRVLQNDGPCLEIRQILICPETASKFDGKLSKGREFAAPS